MSKEKSAWISLLFAGLLEIVWATTMKLSEGFTVPGPTLWTIGYQNHLRPFLLVLPIPFG